MAMFQVFSNNVFLFFLSIITLNYFVIWLVIYKKSRGISRGIWLVIPAAIIIFLAISLYNNSNLRIAYKEITIEENGISIIKERCLRCHSLGSQGNKFAPDLSELKVGYNSRGKLTEFLRDPEGAASGMPRQILSSKEIEDVSITLWNIWFKDLGNKEKNMRNQPSLDPIFRGEEVFKRNCQGCHLIEGYDEKVGPDIIGVIRSFSREELKKFLNDPTASPYEKAMPRIYLLEGDKEALLSYLEKVKVKSRKNSMIINKNNTIYNQNLGSLLKIMDKKGCFGCHKLGSKGGNFGPELDNLGSRRDKAWIKKILKDPAVQNPKGTMPKLSMTDQEIEVIASYLSSLK